MQKYEYATVWVHAFHVQTIDTPKYGKATVGDIGTLAVSGPSLFETLNRMGPDGWDVCGVCENTVILKRPVA